MVHTRFILRQVVSAKKQSLIFVLCVVLSIVMLVALSGFGDSVNNSLLRDARRLQAGDIIIDSSYALSQPVQDKVAEFEAQGLIKSARLYQFYSVVRVVEEDNSLLSELKVVEPGYPFYGEIELASQRSFNEVLVSGSVIVAQELLDQLNLSVGDPLQVGEQTLTIQDVVLYEPDQPVSFFSLGPRIFVAAADLEAINLIKPGSRVSYTTLLKVFDESNLDRLADQLNEIRNEEFERVETFKSAESQVKRFFDNLLLFLSLVGVFTLILAGIGIQSSLTAFLKEREKTIAIVKTVGATSRFVTLHYLLAAAILGMIGTALGLVVGFMTQALFPIIFQNFLPPNVELIISGSAIGESLLLGAFVVGVFTFLPIYQLQELKPNFIFQKEVIPIQKRPPYYLAILLMFLFFVGMVLWQLQDLRIGLYFVLGVVALVLLTALLTEIVLYFLKRTHIKALAPRQALRGLFRPRNATRAIVITLATSLSVIFSIYLIERNLEATFVASYPDDSPNVFFLDIQPDQREAFDAMLGIETEYYPVVRARVTALNGTPINRETERQERGDNLARTFSLTYRDDLLDSEALVAGDSLFSDGEAVQVSILDEMSEERSIEVGDVLSFDVQGIQLDATISSIRRNTSESIQPFFIFVFPEKVLGKAPQSIFTAVRVDPDEITSLQNKIVAAFPNVSVINITETIETLAGLVRQLTQIIGFFALFSIIAGVLIIISSVLATRFARIQEAVYFKVLGAKRVFVFKVFALENLFLGLVSALLGLMLAQVGSWIITTQLFELDYQPYLSASLLLILTTILLVTTVGLLASVSILRQKPITFLREQTVE